MNTLTRVLALSTIVITPIAVGQADKNDCRKPSALSLMQNLLHLSISEATNGQLTNCASQDALENQYVSQELTDSAYRLELKKMDSPNKPTHDTTDNMRLLNRSDTDNTEITNNQADSSSISTLKGFTTVQK